MTYRNKQKLREKIWGVLERNDLIRTSKSCFGRIPNFKGASMAALRLKNTSEWKNSQTIFSSPDSALREVREHALEDNKILIMATPKIKEGYLLINPQKVSGCEKMASTINGAFRRGEKITNFPQIDLVVEGSLAVDIEGNRLGKGKGFADQEISHLYSKKAIDENIPICTPVHWLQIVGQVPVEDHDEKISMIVTPEMVIRTDSITEI
jgi:5-formyltetrahydrofolate cyclo-ligase